MIEVDSIELYKSEKLIAFEKAISLVDRLKSEGKKVGLCHGGFDLLHPGHVKHFESAKKHCDVLFVSITADKFVTSRKGTGRPLYTDKLRAYIIAAIEFVDFVVISDFKKGVEVINRLKSSFYIKGPDFIHKTTPGITSEREAIASVGGEMKYTTEPPMSTTGIIDYIKNELDVPNVLLCIDRDNTLIKDPGFFGKNENWKEELEFNSEVVSFISHLQTKYKTTKIVVTHQAGVARRLFDVNRVLEVNSHINSILASRGIKIDNWQYCPNVDSVYASAHPELNLNPQYIKDKTKRKPGISMVVDGLKELGKNLNEFSHVIVIGDRHEDKGLAENLNAVFVDVNDKGYEDLVSAYNKETKK